MMSPVRQLVDDRRAELMTRLEELEELRASGEGYATWPLELSLISDELAWLERLLETLIAEAEDRAAVANMRAAIARLTRGRVV